MKNFPEFLVNDKASLICGRDPCEPELLRYWEGQMIQKNLPLLPRATFRQEGEKDFGV